MVSVQDHIKGKQNLPIWKIDTIQSSFCLYLSIWLCIRERSILQFYRKQEPSVNDQSRLCLMFWRIFWKFQKRASILNLHFLWILFSGVFCRGKKIKTFILKKKRLVFSVILQLTPWIFFFSSKSCQIYFLLFTCLHLSFILFFKTTKIQKHNKNPIQEFNNLFTQNPFTF